METYRNLRNLLKKKTMYVKKSQTVTEKNSRYV